MPWPSPKRRAPSTTPRTACKRQKTYLARAEDYLKRKQGKTPIGTAARGATQMAEDARVLTLRRKEQERIANEKQAMLDKQQKAEAEAQASA